MDSGGMDMVDPGVRVGKLWAYYELGWGGWWFWDPVETISLLPWLAATALLHTLRADSSEKTTLSLALAGFIFCLMILFFVRSGSLTSIHSFAVDAERGLLLFGILSMITLVVFLVCFKNYGFWGPHLSLRPAEVFGEGVGGNLQKWYHNEGRSPRRLRLLVMTRMLFSVQTLCIWMAILSLLLAIIYPLLAEQWGQTISISPFYFQATFIPLSLPILLSMGLAPWMTKMPAAAMTTT